MPSEWQTANPPDDRERINRARQAAEDLFQPRRQATHLDPSASTPNAQPADSPPRRPPRVFMIAPVRPMNASKAETPTEPKPVQRKAAIRREAREIPASQIGRVRTLTNYGMTRAEVAALYGVTVDEIERVTRG